MHTGRAHIIRRKHRRAFNPAPDPASSRVALSLSLSGGMGGGEAGVGWENEDSLCVFMYDQYTFSYMMLHTHSRLVVYNAHLAYQVLAIDSLLLCYPSPRPPFPSHTPVSPLHIRSSARTPTAIRRHYCWCGA